MNKEEENNNGNERGRKGRIFFQIIVSTVGSTYFFLLNTVNTFCLLAELTRSSQQGLTC